MENTDLLEQITALADNEIHDQELITKLTQRIENEPGLKYELHVQSYLKNIIKSHLGNSEPPPYLREQIIKQIVFENTSRLKYKVDNAPVPWWQYLLRPQYAFGILVVIAAVGYFLLFQNNGFEQLANQQNGRNNMFVQARQNFSKIVKGQLPVQLFSNDPNTIKGYFKQKGVEYQTEVPRIDGHEIVGATISESKGEKFAHHIYKNTDGKLIYFYQVDEKCIKKDKCLNLSKDLMSMLDNGKYFTYRKEDQSFLVWKHDKNICIIVSNEEDLTKLESTFISQKW